MLNVIDVFFLLDFFGEILHKALKISSQEPLQIKNNSRYLFTALTKYGYYSFMFSFTSLYNLAFLTKRAKIHVTI